MAPSKTTSPKKNSTATAGSPSTAKDFPSASSPNAANHTNAKTTKCDHHRQSKPTSHKKKNSYKHRVFSQGADGIDGGYMLMYIKKPKSDDATMIYPITSKIKKHASLRKALNIHGVYPRRNPNGANVSQKQSASVDFDFLTLVSKKIERDQNTPEARKKWAEQAIETFDDIGRNVGSRSDMYNWTMSFTYAGDTSPATLLPPSKYLLNQNVLDLMQKACPTLSLEELAQDNAVLTAYFGKEGVKKGRHIMLSTAQPSSTSSSSSDSDH